MKPCQTSQSRTAVVASAFAALTLIPAMALAAADSTAGDAKAEALYEANCTKCHGTEVYTREDRRIHSLDALETQVRQCETNLELKWFDDDVMAVTNLLNEQYYHFKP